MAADSFFAFAQARRTNLRTIASATRGEHTLDDVLHEAWLLGLELAGDGAPDYSSPQFQQTLLAHLFQKLVRYTETTVRHAARLDQTPADHDAGDATNPITARLAGHEDEDPLVAWVRAEESRAHAEVALERASPAGLWMLLLERFDRRMPELSRFLRISVSHAYRCRGKARAATRQQHSVAFEVSADMLRPWRRRWAERVPRQLAFDFGGDVPLFENARSPR